MKEDELDELRELNRRLQTLMKEKDDHADILRHNLNVNLYDIGILRQMKISV